MFRGGGIQHTAYSIQHAAYSIPGTAYHVQHSAPANKKNNATIMRCVVYMLLIPVQFTGGKNRYILTRAGMMITMTVTMTMLSHY